MPKKVTSQSDLVLRCYSERQRDGTWFAMCVDLNLCVHANSANDAKQKLRDLIAQCVRGAFTGDRESAGILPRRAPLNFFAEYYWIRFLCAIRGMRDGTTRRKRIFIERLRLASA